MRKFKNNVLAIAAIFFSVSSVFGQWDGAVPGVQSTTNKVGIGITSPAEQLEVVSGNRKVGLNYVVPGAGAQTGGILALSRVSDGGKRMLLGMTATPLDEPVVYGEGGGTEMRFVSGGLTSQGFGFYMNVTAANAFAATRPTGPVMKIDGNGNVGIGTSTPDARLTVKGSIHAEEVKVDLNVPAPDYVFEDDYKLPTLTELQAYLKANKHLPEVPPAKEMEVNGVELKAMNMILLKKVEELTLYLIEQQEQIKKQHEEIKLQQEEIKRQGKAIEVLEGRGE